MPVELRIGTLNVWAVPFRSPRVEERMVAIVERAAALDLDVLALQEVWTREAESALVAAGAERGYRSLWPSGRRAGGLMALSRIDARSIEFTPFAVAGLPQRVRHADFYGGKGCVVAHLDVGGRTVVLVITHLQARYAAPGMYDEYQGIRAAQVAQLVSRIEGLGDPVLAVGDFNIREGEPEYEVFVGCTGLLDTAAFHDDRLPTVVGENPLVGAGYHGDERIDYVFVSRAVRPIDTRRDFDDPHDPHSDHAGVVADVELFGSPLEAESGLAEDDRSAAADALDRLLADGRSAAIRRRRNHRLRAVGLALGAAVGRRAGLGGAAVTLLAAALGQLALAEWFVRAELSGFDSVRRG